jgi:hypothetical protein
MRSLPRLSRDRRRQNQSTLRKIEIAAISRRFSDEGQETNLEGEVSQFETLLSEHCTIPQTQRCEDIFVPL